jgi:hypothetical protein
VGALFHHEPHEPHERGFTYGPKVYLDTEFVELERFVV